MQGYCFWTISDNWEWADGYGPKFGLVAVDRHNDLARHPRPSYDLYTEVIIIIIPYLFVCFFTLICPIRLPHANLSMLHSTLNIYHHINKIQEFLCTVAAIGMNQYSYKYL